MLIVKARIPDPDALMRAASIVRGDVVSLKREAEGFVAKLVVREEAQLEELRGSGAVLEILFDSRTRPDPREEVSKVDRYAEELRRLKRGNTKA